MKKTVFETKLYRSEMNEKILNSGFRDFNKFFALDNKAYIIVIPHLRYAFQVMEEIFSA